MGNGRTEEPGREAGTSARGPASGQDEGAAARAKAYSIGWGLDSSEEQEGIGMRKAIFFACAAVVCLIGGWFMLTTVTADNRGRHALNAPNPAAPGQAAPSTATTPASYTVKLLEFTPSKANRAKANDLAAHESVKSLAGANEFRLIELPNGHTALCVGRFARRDAPELKALLAKFQKYVERGSKVFADAVVLGPVR